MLIEFDFISPEVVSNLVSNGNRVYMLPRLGRKLYRLKSDGTTITVCLVQNADTDYGDIVIGYTQGVIHAGQNLVLPMEDSRKLPKVHPQISVICATKVCRWATRSQALIEMEMIKQAQNWESP